MLELSSIHYDLMTAERYTVIHLAEPVGKDPVLYKEGQNARVQALRRDDGKVIAIKYALSPDKTAKIQREETALRMFEQHLPPGEMWTPTGAKLISLESQTGTVLPNVLCMEYLPEDEYPDLFDVYRDRVSDTTPQYERLQAELMAWDAAHKYLTVVNTGISHGIYTGDRKRDTFRWDESTSRLIVMDWNEVRNVDTQNPEAVIKTIRLSLRIFAQVWYTLLTRRDADSSAPGLFNDTQWRDITFFGRRLIADLILPVKLSMEIPTIQRRIKRVLGYLEDHTLSSSLQAIMTAFDRDALRTADADQRLDWLEVVDFAMRHFGSHHQQAASIKRLHDALRTSFMTAGTAISPDSRRSVPSILVDELATMIPVEQWYRDALLQALETGYAAISDTPFRRQLATLSDLLRHKPGDLTQLPPDYPQQLDQTINELKVRYQQVAESTDLDLGKIEAIATAHISYFELHRALRRGDLVHAQRELDLLRQAPDRYMILDALPAMLQQRLNALDARLKAVATGGESGGSPASRLEFLHADLRTRIIEAATAATVQNSREPLAQLRSVIKLQRSSEHLLPVEDNVFLIYEDHLAHCLTAYDVYADADHRQQALAALVDWLHAYPEFNELKPWVRTTPLYQAVQTYFRQQKAHYDAAPGWAKGHSAVVTPLLKLGQLINLDNKMDAAHD